MAAASPRLNQTLRDVAALAGCAMAGYGAWLAWAPAGFMIGGVLLTVAALVGNARAQR